MRQRVVCVPAHRRPTHHRAMEQGPLPLPSTTRSTFRRRTRFRSAAAALCWSVVAVVLALSAGPAILFCAAEGEATGGSGVLPSAGATGAPTAAPTRRPIVLVFDGEKATIEGGPSDNDDDDDESDREPYSRGWINYAFYFFRYGALLCLVCYPCVRGLGVWHSAGGRILLRYSSYDDRGRGIGLPTGLRYRPADIERWLFLTGLVDPAEGGPGSHPHGPHPPRAVPDRLTHAEVLALPEISAPAPLRGEDEHQHQHGTAHGFDRDCGGGCDCHQTAEVVRIGAGKEEGSPTEEHAEPGGGPCTRADAGEAAASTATPTTTTTTTKSTACSICLDDFEAGEPLRLLPRCGHAFHTDCILPWLTERQGVCPYCKVPVKEPPRGSDEDEDEGVGVDVDEEAGGGRRGP